MPKNISDTLGDRLRMARAACGLTQAAVGKEVGVNARAVSQWETNVTRPAIDHFPGLAALYGVTIDWLQASSSKPRSRRRPIGPPDPAEREALAAEFAKHYKAQRNFILENQMLRTALQPFAAAAAKYQGSSGIAPVNVRDLKRAARVLARFR